MEMLFLTLEQMLMMFTLMLMGFLLRRKRILPEGSDVTLARLETYLILPALNFFNQLTNCSVDTLRQNASLIAYGGMVAVIFMLLAQPLSSLFVREAKKRPELAYERNIYKYALTFGNFGFMGNFIVLEIWGAEGLFKYTLFCFVLTLICNTWGLYLLVPKAQGSSFMKSVVKGLTSPPTIALAAGCIGGLLNLSGYLPRFLNDALDGMSGCMGPIAMVLAGIVIGGYDVKGLISDKKIYAATMLRLIAVPAVAALVLRLIGAGDEIVGFAIIAFAAPFGLNTIVFPATYGGDTKTGASMAVVSHLLSVITLPVMYYISVTVI